jgi:hypothetical protein
MQITPLFGEEPITASNVTISVNGSDRARAIAAVERCRTTTSIYDADSFTHATRLAGELKAMLDEIELSRKSAKTPFTAIGRAIDGAAAGVATPVENEHKRVLGLLNGYVAKLEAERKEEERRQNAARMLAQAQADRKVREAEEAQAKAQKELQAAQDEIERARLKIVAQQRENMLLQEQLARELQADVDELGKPEEAPRGLVPGGRVDHLYEFELVDVAACVKAGCWRLVKWTLDIMACRDSVKSQVEMLPPDQEPTLPGIKITKKLNVSVKAASRIR